MLGQPDEPGNAKPDLRTIALADRPDRQVALVIDLGEVVELVVGQRTLGREEPRVARLRRQQLEAGVQ